MSQKTDIHFADYFAIAADKFAADGAFNISMINDSLSLLIPSYYSIVRKKNIKIYTLNENIMNLQKRKGHMFTNPNYSFKKEEANLIGYKVDFVMWNKWYKVFETEEKLKPLMQQEAKEFYQIINQLLYTLQQIDQYASKEFADSIRTGIDNPLYKCYFIGLEAAAGTIEKAEVSKYLELALSEMGPLVNAILGAMEQMGLIDRKKKGKLIRNIEDSALAAGRKIYETGRKQKG